MIFVFSKFFMESLTNGHIWVEDEEMVLWCLHNSTYILYYKCHTLQELQDMKKDVTVILHPEVLFDSFSWDE